MAYTHFRGSASIHAIVLMQSVFTAHDQDRSKQKIPHVTKTKVTNTMTIFLSPFDCRSHKERDTDNFFSAPFSYP